MSTVQRVQRKLWWIMFGVSVALLTGSAQAKECYAPDARAQERAFSRAVITVTGFARPGVMVEVQGIAVVGGK